MPNVASFEVDHRKMQAPFVRLSKSMEIPSNSHNAMVYDIRVKTPNTEEAMPLHAVHSLEHLLATFIRESLLKIDPQENIQVIDISPMGCRTGFYASLIAPKGSEQQTAQTLAQTLADACQEVLKVDEVPAANEIQCGTAADHDLNGAKKICQDLLNKFDVLPIQSNDDLLLS